MHVQIDDWAWYTLYDGAYITANYDDGVVFSANEQIHIRMTAFGSAVVKRRLRLIQPTACNEKNAYVLIMKTRRKLLGTGCGTASFGVSIG
jgi:hypothetical protein